MCRFNPRFTLPDKGYFADFRLYFTPKKCYSFIEPEDIRPQFP